ncbi:MAG: Trm112 family protein [Phycisphaeraceae bacterium]
MLADTTPDSETPPTFDLALLDILVCPLTRSPLRLEGDELVAERPDGAGLRYPIRDGIPVLLIDQARLPEGVADLDTFKQQYKDEIAPDL